MTALHCLPGTGRPTPLTPCQAWRAALQDLEAWEEAVYRAHLAVIDSAPGHMLAAVALWREAERQLEMAGWREKRARAEANGRRWLRSVAGGARG